MTITAKELYNKLDPYVVERIRSIVSAATSTTNNSGLTVDAALLASIRDSSIVVIDPTAVLNNERTLAVSGALSLNDGGPGDSVTLGLETPGTLAVDSSNDATTNHTHAVTASSSPGVGSALLKSGIDGSLTLTTVTASVKVRTDTIDTASGNLALNPASATVTTTNLTGTGTLQGATIIGTTKLRTPLIDTASGNLTIAPAGAVTAVTGALTVSTTAAVTTSLSTPLIITASGDLTLDPAGSNVAIAANANVTGSIDATGNINADQGLTAANSAFRVIYHTHDGTDHAHVVIDPAEDWILDEAFDVDVGQNLLVRGYIVGKHALQLPGAVMICHYDGKTPYTLDYEGTTIGHKGQIAALDGGVIFRPGRFSKAIQVADQTENLITNPSFETGVTGWTAGGGATFTQDETRFYVGAYGAKLLASDASGTVTSNTFDAYADDFTSVSLWYQKATSIGGTGKVRIDYYNVSNAFISSAELELPAGNATEWTYATLSAENPAGARYGKLLVTTQGCASGAIIYIDAVQAENYYASTPYADGTLGTGHAWVGTAHASKSTRTGARVTYSTDTLKTINRKFTVGCWLRRSGASSGYVWSFANGTSLRVGV